MAIMRPVLFVGALVLALLTPIHPSAAAEEAPPSPCATLTVPHVEVRTAAHKLYLCDRERAVASSFDVRLARNGVGKTRTGDKKVPLGSYPLGQPRRSKQYGTFVPIGFPLPEQRRRGYTGGDVGVHGPDRRVRWLGGLVNTFDTTDGCVGLASDQEMDSLTAWLRRSGAHRIILVDR
jgi:hypothetical protein